MTASLDFSEFRRQMPVTERWAYFDHAAVAPISGPARQALADWSTEAAAEGDTLWHRWAGRIEKIRATFARLIGAASDEIALVPNTTSGIGLVAEGYPWKSGDNVVTLADEYPSNQYPWLNLASRGVETRRVPVEGGKVDLERLAGACDERTRIVSVSWVGFVSGWRIDPVEVARLVHERGALLFLDAIQGLGVFPLDAQAAGVDFLAADGHKWLLGPEGAGFLYMRREHLPLLRPLMVGAGSVIGRSDFGRIEFDLRDEAARYEGGSPNMGGFLALGASLDLLESCGLGTDASAVAERVLAITDLACQRLTESGAELFTQRHGEHRSGIVSFTLPGRDPAEMRKSCLADDVALSCRVGRLRISPHAYTNEEDIERLMSSLATA